MPEIQRPEPAYVQIANYYRDAINRGELGPGDRLPSIADLAEQWHVAKATAATAISRLQVERAVYTSPMGTFVSSDDRVATTPGDRIRGPRPVRVAPGETVHLTGAGIVLAPNYVAELLGIEPGSEVIRREEVTSLRGRPRMLSVDWIPGANVMEAAELLGPLMAGGPAHVIATVTGRHVTHAQDHLEGREADAREAGALKLPVGSAILAGTHVWSDQDGPILYGEWVMPSRQVVTYSYEVTNGADLGAERPARTDSTSRAGLDHLSAYTEGNPMSNVSDTDRGISGGNAMNVDTSEFRALTAQVEQLAKRVEELHTQALVIRTLRQTALMDAGYGPDPASAALQDAYQEGRASVLHGTGPAARARRPRHLRSVGDDAS